MKWQHAPECFNEQEAKRMEKTEDLEINVLQPAVLVALAVPMLLASFGTSVANVALPVLATTFGAPFAEVQAVVVAYLAALTITVVIAGRLGDRFGLKPMLLAGLGLFFLASCACAMSPGLGWLIAARAVQGVGAAFLMTLSMALMRQMADKARLGRAMGLLGTISALGTALGPSLGGMIIPLLGWRNIFWLQAPLSLLALVLAILALPDRTEQQNTPERGLWAVLNQALLINLFVNVLVAAVMMATLVIGPFYLGLRLGLEVNQIGLVMAVGPLLSILSGVPSGRLVDVWGSHRVLTTGLVLLAVGSFLLSILPNMIGLAGYLSSIMLLTPGYQLFQAANNTAALRDVSAQHRGSVSGTLNLSRNIGLVAGASVMGMVFAYGAGTSDIIHATREGIEAGMQLTFLTAGAMTSIAIAIIYMGRWADQRGARANGSRD
ncbi:MFS transporter [Agrobacterium sp.]|uniref:MFS transporter n=1 Tax=Agrobacterium sp. TaxID=361 RepID=UPI0028A8AA92|nr:MFS transporter [Agrobacterium sp.]